MINRRNVLEAILGAGASLVGLVIGKREDVTKSAEIGGGMAVWYKDPDGVGRWHPEPKAVVDRHAAVTFVGRAEKVHALATRLILSNLRTQITGLGIVDGVDWMEIGCPGCVLAWITGGRYFVREITAVGDVSRFVEIGTAQELAAAGVVRIRSAGLIVDLT